MHTRRLVALVVTLLLMLSLAPTALAQQVDTPLGPPVDRGPEDRGRSADAPGRVEEPEPAPQLPGQPRNDVLEDVPDNPDDASLHYNLIP